MKKYYFQLPNFHTPFQLVDLNGDGFDDLLFGSSQVDRISWLPNLGTFADWGSVQHIELPNSLTAYDFSVHANDFDGDGDMDIVYYEQSADEIIWHENQDGLGSFGSPIIIQDIGPGLIRISSWILIMMVIRIFWSPIYGTAKSVGTKIRMGWVILGQSKLLLRIFGEALETQFADLDSDGDLDFVNGDAQNGILFWVENFGLGNFSDQKILGYPTPGISNIELGDIDNDGDTDIFASSANPSTTFWLENLNGSGVFSNTRVIDNINALSLYVVDFNLDQTKDLAFASNYFSSIGFFENLTNVPRISGVLFHDENENQVFDANEWGILNQSLEVQPNVIVQFSGLNGHYDLFVEDGNYSISPTPHPNWVLTTTPETYNINFQDSTIQDINFGFLPTQSVLEVQTTISSAPTRCGFQVPFWLTYTNTGTEPASGKVVLELDPLSAIIDINPAPDSLSGNQVFWFFEQLPPTYHRTIDLLLQIPGPDQINTILEYESRAWVIDSQDGLTPSGELFSYHSEIRCAYDPNDKLVEPEGTYRR